MDENTERMKFLDLLRQLEELTAQGKVNWSDTADEDMFRAVLPSAMVRIGKSRDGTSEDGFARTNEQPAYEAYLLDKRARIVQEVHFGPGSLDDYNTSGDYKLLARLYDSARSDARGASGLLDRVLEEVKSAAS